VRATIAQLQYVDALARQARTPVPHVETADQASAAIDDLQRQIELTDKTRMAIFAALRDTPFTKEDMYAACEITSLAANSAASEYDGKRCLRWIKGETVEVKRGADINNQEIKPMTPHPIRRPAPLTREQRIPADAIPFVDADPTTGAPLEFRPTATPQPILLSAEAKADAEQAQRAISVMVTMWAKIGQVVDASTCRTERIGAGPLAGTIAYQVSGAGVTPRIVLVYPDGARWEDFQRRGDPATIAWTQTLAEFLRAPF
jgi:hypothetical protein